MLQAVAGTSLVAVAFLVPLLALVGALADDRAVRPAELAARSIAPAVALVEQEVLADVLAATAADLAGTASVVRADGEVLGTPVPLDEVHDLVRQDRTARTVTDGTLRRVLVPVVTAAGVAVVDVRVEVDPGGVRLARVVLVALGVALVAGATLLADRLGRDVVRAASRLEATAERLSRGELHARAEVDQPEDLARVGAALDDLAGRIEALLVDAREEAADLSHGLRTPATALRLDVESLPPGPGRARLEADLEALDAVMSEVIAAVRAPGRGSGRCDLAAVAQQRVRFWAGLAEDEGRGLASDLEQDVIVPLSAEQVATVVDVLLDNAVRHTAPGTAVAVRVERLGHDAVLEVEDAGVGLPEGMDVLARGSSGAGGTGLGLDIVVRTAAHVGGRVETGSGALGGALLRVVLPAPSERSGSRVQRA